MDVFTRFTGSHDRNSILNSNQHHKIQLTLFPRRPFFVAGGSFQGTVKILCKSQDIYFKDLRVELFGFEEISRNGLLNRETKRHPFANLRKKISDSADFLSSEEEIFPGGYLSVEKGEQNIPFELDLPLSLPSSTDNSRNKRIVSIKYIAVGSVDVKLPSGQLITVTQSHAITIYEKFQLKPNLNIKLTETPQNAENFHSMSGNSPSIMLRLTIPRVIWVAGNVLSAQITIRGAIRKRIQRIQLDLIEDTKHFRNSDLAFDKISSDWILNDDSEPLPYEDSVTLANIPSVSLYNSNSNSSSRNETTTLREKYSHNDNNPNIATSSRVVAKRVLTGNLIPSQIRLESEERTWNIQLQVPSDAYTIHKTKFSTINYRIKVTVNFSFSLRIDEEIPIILFHPLSLDGDPYNSLRDGVIITTPHAFEDGQKYKVYEQPLVLFKNSLNPTSKSEHLSICHSAQNILSSDNDFPPSPSFYSSSKSPYSDTDSTRTTFPEKNIVESPSSSPLLNPAMNHSAQDLQFIRNRRNSAHSHRRVHSELNKKEFFFNSKGSGELPHVNSEWDWLTNDNSDKAGLANSERLNIKKGSRKNRGSDLVIDVSTPASSDTLPILYSDALTTTPVTERSFQNKECGVSRASTIKSKSSKISADSNYTVKFPKSPSVISENLLSRRRRAASLGGQLFSLPENGNSSTPKSVLHPISPHFRQKFHPEIVARKYSFPPKTNNVPVTPSTASTFPTMTFPLKSALVTHKRSHTYSGPRGVRFALEEDDTETVKEPIVAKIGEVIQSSPVSIEPVVELHEYLSPSHSDGIWLTHINYPPDKLISPNHPTSSPPQWKVITLAALPPSPISRKNSLNSSSSSDSSFIFSVPVSTFHSAMLPDIFEPTGDPESTYTNDLRNDDLLDELNDAKFIESPEVCTVELSSDGAQNFEESLLPKGSLKVLETPLRISNSDFECPIIESNRISPMKEPNEFDAWNDPYFDYQPELNEFSEPTRSQRSFKFTPTSNFSSLQPLNPSKTKVYTNSKFGSHKSRPPLSHSKINQNNCTSVTRGRTLELGKNFKFSSPTRQLSELDKSKHDSLIKDKTSKRNTPTNSTLLSYLDSHIKQD